MEEAPKHKGCQLITVSGGKRQLLRPVPVQPSAACPAQPSLLPRAGSLLRLQSVPLPAVPALQLHLPWLPESGPELPRVLPPAAFSDQREQPV